MATSYLICGGAGFLGANLAHRLMEQDSECHVTCVDDLQGGSDSRRLQGLEEDERFTFVEASISDARAMDRIFTKHAPTLVVNVAGAAGQAAPEALIERNVKSLVSLLKVAAEDWREPDGSFGQGKFLQVEQVSSTSDPYFAASLKAGWEFAAAMQESEGFPVMALRCGDVYGPWQDPASHPADKLIEGGEVAAKALAPGMAGKWTPVEALCAYIAEILSEGEPGMRYETDIEFEGATEREAAELFLKSTALWFEKNQWWAKGEGAPAAVKEKPASEKAASKLPFGQKRGKHSIVKDKKS